MICGDELLQYINKVMLIKTENGMYLKLDNVSEHNNLPTFIFTQNRSCASEFVFTKKTNTNIAIRLNCNMKNQNGTFGYHLYVIPENDLVYGAGNDELFAQFNLEQREQFIVIKSVYKHTYFSHKYNILRSSRLCEHNSFILEEAHIPFVQRNICIISYGYPQGHIELSKSPIINTLKEIYPQSIIDIHMLLPNTINEFSNIPSSASLTNIDNNNVNLSLTTHNNDIKYFMKIAHSYALPIISDKHKIYSYRTISMLWNISESIKVMLSKKRVYNIYILMRNDMFGYTCILKKIFDNNKLYCCINECVDTHLFIGKDVLTMNHLYDFYIRNKTSYIDEQPNKIITDFLCSHNIQLGDIHNITPAITYPINHQKLLESFYKNVIAKYKEIIGIAPLQNY